MIITSQFIMRMIARYCNNISVEQMKKYIIRFDASSDRKLDRKYLGEGFSFDTNDVSKIYLYTEADTTFKVWSAFDLTFEYYYTEELLNFNYFFFTKNGFEYKYNVRDFSGILLQYIVTNSDSGREYMMPSSEIRYVTLKASHDA